MKMLCLLLLSISSLFFAQEPPLVVGTTSGYAPYVSLNEQGEYEGFDIDFARLLGEKMQRKIVIRDFGSMPGLMMALKQGKADLLLWAISITQERKEKIELIYYQGEITDSAPFIFWEKIPQGLRDIGDLAGAKAVCVEAGSFQEELIRAFPSVAMQYVDKVSDAILAVRHGKCAAATIDPALVAGYRAKYPQLKVVLLPIPASLQAQGNGIAVRKNNQALAEAVQQAVRALREEGKVEELEKKWKITQAS